MPKKEGKGKEGGRARLLTTSGRPAGGHSGANIRAPLGGSALLDGSLAVSVETAIAASSSHEKEMKRKSGRGAASVSPTASLLASSLPITSSHRDGERTLAASIGNVKQERRRDGVVYEIPQLPAGTAAKANASSHSAQFLPPLGQANLAASRTCYEIPELGKREQKALVALPALQALNLLLDQIEQDTTDGLRFRLIVEKQAKNIYSIKFHVVCGQENQASVNKALLTAFPMLTTIPRGDNLIEWQVFQTDSMPLDQSKSRKGFNTSKASTISEQLARLQQQVSTVFPKDQRAYLMCVNGERGTIRHITLGQGSRPGAIKKQHRKR